MKELCAEGKRIKFIVERDGEEAARAFCKQGLAAYKIELSKPYRTQYRRGLIHSCIVFRRILSGEYPLTKGLP